LELSSGPFPPKGTLRGSMFLTMETTGAVPKFDQRAVGMKTTSGKS